LPLPRWVDYSLRFIAPISLGLAIYFHYQSVQERVPTYYVSPTRARIVDTSIPAPPQLQVLYKGKALNANVSAAVVYFWNDGKLPIKAEDVLEPLKIELDPACEIIDARILKVSRDVTKFTKGEVSAAKNVLPVSFGILERNDGAQIQIIFTGRPEARVSVSGTIVGASQIRETITLQDRPPSKHRRLEFLLFYILLAALAVLGALTLSRYSRWVREGRVSWRLDRWFAVGFFLAMVIPAVGVVGYEMWKSQPTVPPTIWTENQK
jgi:hypothetical protein